MSSPGLQKKLLKKSSKKLTRKYSEENRVMERCVGKLVKSDNTRSIGMVMGIGRAIPKFSFIERSELAYFSWDLRWS